MRCFFSTLFKEKCPEAHVKVVFDGEEAVEALYGRGSHAPDPPPDVVLLDLNLPKKNGFEVFNGLQNLADGNLGNRKVLSNLQNITAQIRSILHDMWSREERVHLKVLQKVGVAIAKAVDEKDNIEETIAGSIDAVEKLLDKLGRPINTV
jgi:CheY-like chemotaxis protein